MNSIHSQSIDEMADSNDLGRTLKLMEEFAAPAADRGAVAIDFIDEQKYNWTAKIIFFPKKSGGSESTVDNQQPTGVRSESWWV